MSESNTTTNKKTAGSAQNEKNKIETAVKKSSAQKAREKSPQAKSQQVKPGKTIKQPVSRIVPVLWFVVILLAVGSVGGGYFIWQELQSTVVQQNAQRQIISEDVSNLQSGITQMDRALKTSLSDQRSATMNRLQQEFQLLRDELSIMRPEIQQTQKPDWIIAEVDYLIRVANHRLQLEHDIDMAVMALFLADERLRTLSNPEALLVRRQLKNEIAQLKALPRLDVEGMSLTLSSLQKQIESLPVNGYEDLLVKNNEKNIELEPATAGQNFFTDVWGELKGLVSVRKINETERVLVTPDQRIYLLENLELKIEAARFALIKNNNVLFHASLQAVDEWLMQYFDADSAAFASIKETLSGFNDVILNQPLPIIKESMIALQTLQKNVQLNQSATVGDSSAR